MTATASVGPPVPGLRDETLARLAAPVADALALAQQQLAELVPAVAGDPAREVYLQMLGAGGKRLRPLLALLSCAAAGGDAAEAVRVAVAAEVIHLASLFHDDVIDEAEERRGQPSVRQRWGNRAAVLVGDLLVAEVFQRLAEQLDGSSASLLARAVGEMSRAELACAAASPEPTEEHYRRNIQGKTATLMGAVCEAGARCAASEAAARHLRQYGRKLGEAFQISDDLLDLYGEAEVVGKPALQDLRRGQWTLPVLYALRQGTPEQGRALRESLSAATWDPRAAREAADLAAALGGRDYGRQIAEGLAAEAQEALAPLSPSPARDSLTQLADYVVQRRS
jgi:geranylgeranyl pyrophosphate synthase